MPLVFTTTCSTPRTRGTTAVHVRSIGNVAAYALALLSLRLPFVTLAACDFRRSRPFSTQPIHDGDHLVLISNGIFVFHLFLGLLAKSERQSTHQYRLGDNLPRPSFAAAIWNKDTRQLVSFQEACNPLHSHQNRSVTDTSGPSRWRRFKSRVSRSTLTSSMAPTTPAIPSRLSLTMSFVTSDGRNTSQAMDKRRSSDSGSPNVTSRRPRPCCYAHFNLET